MPSSGVSSALEVFQQTSVRSQLSSSQIFEYLVVTNDFLHVVQLSSTSDRDDFLRPVNWILTSKSERRVLVLSPFEANGFLPDIEASKVVKLHIYAPRVAKTMISFEDLEFYSTPHVDDVPHRITSIAAHNLVFFAGQLYLGSHAKYMDYIQYLREIAAQSATKRSQSLSSSNESNNEPASSEAVKSAPFSKVLALDRAITAMRRRGQPFSHSHKGGIVDRRFLNEDNFT